MKRNSKRTSGSTRGMTRGALIAALYVGLCYVSTVFGLSSGAVQFRLAEVLCILPIFMVEAIPGLFIGCILSNIIAGCVLWDIIFGSVATLIGAIGAYMLRRVPEKFKWVATVPTLIANILSYSVTKSCPPLCDLMDCSTPGCPVLHYVPKFTQIYVH